MSLPSDQQRHEIQLQRIVTRLLADEVNPVIAANLRRINAVLSEAGELRSATQVNRMLSEIRAITRPEYDAAWAKVTEELGSAAVYEAGYYARLVGAYNAVSLTTPAADQIQSYINRSIMSLGEGATTKAGTWAQFVRGGSDAYSDTYDNLIKQAFVRGQTISQTQQQLRQATDGLIKRNAETLARTGMSHYTSQAREAMADANRDVIKKKYLLVTFDNRTTFICMRYGSSDENPWDIDDPRAPVLPLHYNERSIYVYLTEGQEAPSGLRPAVGGEGGKDAEELYQARLDRLRTKSKVQYRGRRDSDLFDVKQVRGSTKYDQWFAEQPAWFQRSTLGPERAKLYRQGGFELTAFTDMTGRKLTLAELRAIDADAFTRAGL
jgi:hypothetical protein